MPMKIAATLLVITALAALLYFLIEVPAKRFLRREWSKRRSAAP
jgi:peptidoglycan/LPS O-acetylase OafA/YrhL